MDFLLGKLPSHPTAWLGPCFSLHHHPVHSTSPFSCQSSLVRSTFLPLGPPAPVSARFACWANFPQQLKWGMLPQSLPHYLASLACPPRPLTPPPHPAMINQTGLLESLPGWVLRVHSPSLIHHHRHWHISQLSISRLWVLNCHPPLQGSHDPLSKDTESLLTAKGNCANCSISYKCLGNERL